MDTYIKRAKELAQQHSLITSALLFIGLLLGIVITVDQVTRQQTINSRASEIQAITNCSISDADIRINDEEQKLLNLINQYRRENDLIELQFLPSLNRAAAWHSKDMAKHKTPQHKDTSGREPSERAKDCGYGVTYAQVRENITAGTNRDTAEEVFKAWRTSQLHNEIMLDEKLRVVGIAGREDKNAEFGWYWTMTLGDRYENGENDPSEATTPKPTCSPDGETQSLAAVGGKRKNSKNDNKGGGKNEKKKKKRSDSDKKDGKGGGKNGKGGKNDGKKNDKKKKKKKKNNNNNENADSGQEEECVPTEDGVGSPEEPGEEPQEEPVEEDPTDGKEDPEENDENPKITKPQTASLQFSVRIPGIEDAADVRTLTVSLTDLNDKTVTQTIQVGNVGSDQYVGFLEHGKVLTTGVYRVRVKLPSSLRKTVHPDFHKLDTTKDLDFAATTLVMGDFDNNNVLNIADFNVFQACMDVPLYEEEELDEEEFVDEYEEEFEEEESATESLGETRIQNTCSQHDITDLNGDGTVDLLDYNLLLENFQNAKGN